jgi:putative inorganic carbon (HCO3(-)) transporter
MTLRSGIRAALGWLADWQILAVAFLAPVFLLADRLPGRVVVVAVLALPLLWGIFRAVHGRFFNPTPVDIPLLLLAATLPVGVWASAMPALSLPSLLQALFGLALFYALVNSLTTERRIQWAGWATIALTGLLAALGLAGTAWGDSAKLLPVDLGQVLPYLIGGVWYSAGFNPNIVGGALAVLAPVTAAYAWAAQKWPRRLLLWLLFVGEAMTLVLTQSRGALIGFLVALLVLVIGRNRRWVWLVLVLAVLGTVGMVLFGVGPTLEFVMDAAGTDTFYGREQRLELWSRGLYMLQDFPFTGVGLGMFPKVLPMLYPLLMAGPGTGVPHVHNVYLQMGLDHAGDGPGNRWPLAC